MADTLLAVRNLKKSFGGVNATDDVSIEVERGELHAIIGPNGAGKTTLIAQLSGDLAPDSGKVLLDGKDITTVPTHRRSHFGMARSFQITSVFMNMSVIDNVSLAVQSHDGTSFRFWRPACTEERLQQPAMDILEKVGLADRAGTIASAMSHGERRQLELAMALATKPRFLLLDEPMAGMGVEESAAMVGILKGLKGDKTILLVEHDMDAVFALADRISVLVYGRVIATGKPADIRRNKAVRDAYLGED
jgi:branched-chain amino acid transport system ATP-binding protein